MHCRFQDKPALVNSKIDYISFRTGFHRRERFLFKQSQPNVNFLSVHGIKLKAMSQTFINVFNMYLFGNNKPNNGCLGSIWPSTKHQNVAMGNNYGPNLVETISVAAAMVAKMPFYIKFIFILNLTIWSRHSNVVQFKNELQQATFLM